MGKAYHTVLVFKQTVWLSVRFGLEQDTQRWRIYRRPRRRPRRGHNVKDRWWKGLILRGTMPNDMKNTVLPTPVLTAYAFTEWSWDVPQRPNGTDLWVEDDHFSNQYQIYYSKMNWWNCLDAGGGEGWAYMGIGNMEP